MQEGGSSKTPNFSATYTFAAHAAEVEVERTGYEKERFTRVVAAMCGLTISHA